MRRRQILFYAVIALIPLLWNAYGFAQIHPGNLSQFTEQDGVPGSEVNRVLPDKFGYIWVGTINGLARYNGYEFRRFYNDPNDPSSIKGLIVWSLFEDRKGQIWIGNSRELLNVYDPVNKSFRQYDYARLVPHAANIEIGVTSMCQDNKGRIYFGIMSYYGEDISTGLLYLDEKENEIKAFKIPDSLATKNVYRIIKDKPGNIWFLSYNGLFKIDTNRKISKVQSSLKEILLRNKEQLLDLKSDNEDHIWFMTTASRLIDFNPRLNAYKIYADTRIFKERKGDYSYKVIVLDKNGIIWIGTNNGLYYFDRQTAKFGKFEEDSKKLEQVAIVDLKIDSFGTLWIGTSSKGLFKFDKRALLKSYSYNKNDKGSLTAGWANNILESRDGKIWITTTGEGNASGMDVFDPRTMTVRPIPYPKLLPGCNFISCLMEISPGEFYMHCNLGLYLLSAATMKVQKVLISGAPETSVSFQVYTDSRENLWISNGKGLFRRNKGARDFKMYDLSKVAGSNASSNEITKFVESKLHGLWLVTNNGLFLYNYKTDKIERHGFDKKAGDIFNAQDINSLYEDARGIAWVGTWQGGFSRYDPETKKIKTFTIRDGLPSMSVQGILGENGDKALWLSTFDGLSRFDVKSGQFNNYSIADGIQSQLFADGAYLKSKGGLFFFGGSNGITVFRPKEVDKNSTPPKVFLTDLKLFNKSIMPGKRSILTLPVYETKEINLAYKQNNISIEFEAIHYSNPSKNQSVYKLENYDNEWRQTGSQHLAYYPMLPPGEYMFRVKAANCNGVWNDGGASLKIIIHPPWWRTNWAYGLYLILLIGVVYAADKYLRNTLIKREKERNSARELEHAREIEKAYKELKATQSQLIQSEKMASLGELTAGIAHEIQNPLNFVNNFSEVNMELISEMKQEIDKKNLGAAKSIANDIAENERKITQHGKRAGAIVKGMLQHSRINSGIKEPTDINALADEYLRLTWHGLRAKDKTFNVTIKTDFDKTIGAINIVPQEIGRVLLNLLTNAFYAVNEKRKLNINGYLPMVVVKTKKIGSRVEISIRDNGTGIPQKVIDKIFQPFFTTKPTGEGTGLGLSISYDIIRAHGGELKVETREGEGSMFAILLQAG